MSVDKFNLPEGVSISEFTADIDGESFSGVRIHGKVTALKRWVWPENYVIGTRVLGYTGRLGTIVGYQLKLLSGKNLDEEVTPENVGYDDLDWDRSGVWIMWDPPYVTEEPDYSFPLLLWMFDLYRVTEETTDE